MSEKILKKHIEIIDKEKLGKTMKRILLIKTAITAGLFSGEPITKVVREIADKLSASETTIWKVIKFDKLYKQIENDYMEVLEYLKQQKLKEMIGETNANPQGP